MYNYKAIWPTNQCQGHPNDWSAVNGSKTVYGVLYIVCLLRLPRPDQLSVHTDAQLCQLNVSLTRLQGLLEYIIYTKVQQPITYRDESITLCHSVNILLIWGTMARRVSVKMEAFKDSCASSTLISVCHITYIIAV